MAIRNLIFDHNAVLTRTESAINVEAKAKAREVLSRWEMLGYLPAKQKDIGKFVEVAQKLLTQESTPKAQIETPHPYRLFDYGGLSFSALTVFNDALGDIVAGIKGGLMLDDLELMTTLIPVYPEYIRRYPAFGEIVEQVGSGAIFTTLCPLMHAVLDAPLFSFESSACSEVAMFDIQSGIDTSYIHAPAPISYFHLKDTGEHTVHDGVSGHHKLDGFYLYEQATSNYTLSPELIKALGMDASKPFRLIQLVFTGSPKSYIGDDTLSKFDLFLQDGISVDDMLSRYEAWYMGTLTHAKEDTENMVTVDGGTYVHDTTNIDTPHNLQLVRVAINYLAYLNFAQFRKVDCKDRSSAMRGVMAKAPKNRKSYVKKVNGKVDAISISSNSSFFLKTVSGDKVKHTKSPHFRRGFLRNQRYGAGDGVYHKPKYIAPTMVAQDNDEAAPPKNYKVN